MGLQETEAEWNDQLIDPRDGRGGKIRTCGLTVPNRAHYQAVLRPVTFQLRNGFKCRILLAKNGLVKSDRNKIQ